MALAVAMLSLLKQCESNFNDKMKRHIPNQYVAITMTAIIVDTVYTQNYAHEGIYRNILVCNNVEFVNMLISIINKTYQILTRRCQNIFACNSYILCLQACL